MKFSVVIVEYGSWVHTTRCVGSLRETGHGDFEVVVVDNDPGPAPEVPHPIRLIRNPTNFGFARACNQGVRASTGDLLVFINPDTLVEGNFFEGFEEFFRDHPRAGVAGPRVVDGGGELQLSARREVGLISGLVGRTSFLTRAFPKSGLVRRFFPAVDRRTGPSEVDWVSGACMMIRREMVEEVGAFDERFFMYFEDADLCRRAREAGWSVHYLPTVEVVHHTGASSRSKPHAIWRLHRSAFLYHRKHGPHGPLNLYSAFVLLGLVVRALAKLAAGEVGKILAR